MADRNPDGKNPSHDCALAELRQIGLENTGKIQILIKPKFNKLAEMTPTIGSPRRSSTHFSYRTLSV